MCQWNTSVELIQYTMENFHGIYQWNNSTEGLSIFHGIIFHGILEFLPAPLEYSDIPSGTHRNRTEQTSKYSPTFLFVRKSLAIFPLGDYGYNKPTTK